MILLLLPQDLNSKVCLELFLSTGKVQELNLCCVSSTLFRMVRDLALILNSADSIELILCVEIVFHHQAIEGLLIHP